MTLPIRTRLSNNYQPSRLFSQYNEEAILLIIREICRATKLTYSSSSLQTSLSNHLGPGTVWPTQVAPFEPVITPVAPFKSVYQTTWDQVEFCLLKYLCPLKPVINWDQVRFDLIQPHSEKKLCKKP